jgi:hypothetical protein
MTKHASRAGPRGSLPSSTECRRLVPELREPLQILERQIQIAQDRFIAGLFRDAVGDGLASKTSAIVILSIAASTMELASFRAGKALDEKAFILAARAAAQDAGDRLAVKRRRRLDSAADAMLP